MSVKSEDGKGYTDFTLRSVDPTSATGLKFNVMKFGNVGGDKTIDPSDDAQFVRPVKLNRKDPRTVRRLTDEDRERWNKRALEAAGVLPDEQQDSKPDKSDDDDDEDKEEIDLSLVGVGTSGSTGIEEQQQQQKNRFFRKKTRRVYLTSAETQRLKKEEWMPWVLEGDDGEQRWIGQLEGGIGASSSSSNSGGRNRAIESQGWRPEANESTASTAGGHYVAFVFGQNGNDFQVVPINRWYKFTRGPRYATLGTEEAEDEYNRMQKNPEIERWIRHKNNPNANAASSSNGQAAAAANTASANARRRAVKAEPASDSSRLRMLDRTAQAARSSVPEERGRRNFRSVIGASGARGGDGDGAGARGSRDADGLDEEMDYEDDFQDDEEGIAKPDQVLDEDEAKELEEKIKREMRLAKGFEQDEDLEMDDDEESSNLTNTGREIKKIVRKRDKTGTYDSDDDDDDDDLFGGAASDDTASVASADGGGKNSRKSKLSTPRSQSRQGSRPPHGQRSQSRAGSPQTSGSAVIARRATSPQPGSSSRSRSRPGSRSGSPSAAESASGTKRKRENTPGGGSSSGGAGADDSSKRRRNGTPDVAGGSGMLITEADLVTFLKTKASFTTKEVLAHFKRQLKAEPRNKSEIAQLLQSVANFANGELQLKPHLQ